jgi:manganese oxidase
VPVDSASEDHCDNSRRVLLRTLTGGGVLATLAASALSGTPATAQALPSVGSSVDPFTDSAFQPSGRVREYWIQAESFEHNAVPNGYDGMTGRHFTPDQTTFWAIGFRAYTANWSHPLEADLGPQGIGANSGLPGPVLRAEVGDVIQVHFRNMDQHYKWPHSMHPHGVRYDRANDGAWLADDPDQPGTAVPYGGSYTYTWNCSSSSVGTWPYHDHSLPQSIAANGALTANDGRGMPVPADGAVMEIGAELGLFGVLAITDEQTPAVDREFVLFLHDISPSDVPSLGRPTDMFNGGSFVDNTPTFTAKNGDRVRWRIASLGNDFHVFHIHGHRWHSQDGWVDSQILGPSTTLTVEYTEDNPGNWLYHCHVNEHMMGGMVGRYTVTV